MYPKLAPAVNGDLNRLSTTHSGLDRLPTPRFVRICSRHQCGKHLPFTDWEDVEAVLSEDMCLLRLADTLYIIPQLADYMWGSA